MAQTTRESEEIPAPRPCTVQGFSTLREVQRYLFQNDFSNYSEMPSFLHDMRRIDIDRPLATALYSLPEISVSGMREHFPIVLEVPNQLLDEMGPQARDGLYLAGTNIILIPSDTISRLLRTPDLMSEAMMHEIVHYSQNLANGDYSITISSRGRDENVLSPLFFYEGFANYAAALLTPQNNRNQLPIPYPHETATFVLLEKLLGLNVLVTAATTGNWRRAQQAFDYHLGMGSFRRFIRLRTGAEAFNFIMERNQRNPVIDVDALSRDPIYMRTRTTIDSIRIRSSIPHRL